MEGMAWWLIVVLFNPSSPGAEQHVTLNMPSKAACELVLNRFTYAEDIKEPNERTKLQVLDKKCIHSPVLNITKQGV